MWFNKRLHIEALPHLTGVAVEMNAVENVCGLCALSTECDKGILIQRALIAALKVDFLIPFREKETKTWKSCRRELEVLKMEIARVLNSSISYIDKLSSPSTYLCFNCQRLLIKRDSLERQLMQCTLNIHAKLIAICQQQSRTSVDLSENSLAARVCSSEDPISISTAILESTSTANNQESTSTLESRESASTVISQELTPTVSHQDSASTLESWESASTIITQESTSTVSNQKSASTLENRELASTVISQESTSTVSSHKSTSTLENQESASTVISQESTSTVSSQKSTSTLENQESASADHSVCPGFTIVIDNVDMNVRRSDQRVDRTTNSYHYCHGYAVMNRVNSTLLSDHPPSGIISVEDVLPNKTDLDRILGDFEVFISR